MNVTKINKKISIVGEKDSDSKNPIDWWVPPYATYANSEDWRYNEGRDCTYEFMKLISSKQNAKCRHWFNPYSIKHDVENWKLGNPNWRYVSRDTVVAAAILLGLPVIIDPESHHNNLVGLNMTRRQYQKVCVEIGVTGYHWVR